MSLVEERLVAIGLLIERSAILEHQIQRAFCALAGSKFAVAVASDQGVGWLTAKCEALVEAHRELSYADRLSVKEALRSCHQAYVRRDEILHSSQAASADHGVTTVDSPPGALSSWTIADVRQSGEVLLRASSELADAIQRALWPEQRARRPSRAGTSSSGEHHQVAVNADPGP